MHCELLMIHNLSSELNDFANNAKIKSLSKAAFLHYNCTYYTCIYIKQKSCFVFKNNSNIDIHILRLRQILM